MGGREQRVGKYFGRSKRFKGGGVWLIVNSMGFLPSDVKKLIASNDARNLNDTLIVRLAGIRDNVTYPFWE